jgi:hypothetical protein
MSRMERRSIVVAIFSTTRTTFGLGTRISRETRRLPLSIIASAWRFLAMSASRLRIGLMELLQADRVCGLNALKRVRLEWIQLR